MLRLIWKSQKNLYVIFPELYKSKKFVKINTLYIKNNQLLIISLLNDEPGVSLVVRQFNSYISVSTGENLKIIEILLRRQDILAKISYKNYLNSYS